MATLLSRQVLVRAAWTGILGIACVPSFLWAQGEPKAPGSLIRSVKPNDKLEMLVKTSQVLTLGEKIPTAQVNDPKILSITPLSPTQVQLFAKKPGITQVNLWDEKQQIHTIEVAVVPDLRELMRIINEEFPKAVIRIRPIPGGLLISGYVDRQSDVDQIQQIARRFYGATAESRETENDRQSQSRESGDSYTTSVAKKDPKNGATTTNSQTTSGAPKSDNAEIIMNVLVGGVQQIVLHVKVMEVSRTKLRTLGFDFSQISSGGGMFMSGTGQMLSVASSGGATGLGGVSPTSAFQIIDGGSTFFGVLNALRQDNLAKLLSEPRLVTTSGRPAYFLVGGEIPYVVPQSLGTTTIDWKQYGTKVDFVPIVLGNNRLRLEVRPQVSEIDSSRAEVNGVPAIKTSMVDTGVEMRAGQTLAIAGLVQRKTEAINRGLPFVSEVPYVGALFRSVREQTNEIESLVLVTPQFVEAMDPEEVPPCGPGSRTVSPSDWQLYAKGLLEVPNPCPPCNDQNCPNHCQNCQNHGKSGAAIQGQPIEAPIGPDAVPGRPEPEGAASQGMRVSPASLTVQRAGGNPYNASGPRGGRSDSSRARSPGQLPGFSGPIGYDTAE
jgi:pilus assembly protein CpaC